MGAAILGSAGIILLLLLLLLLLFVCLLSLRSPPGWVAGGSRAVGVGGWVRGWVGGGVRGGCQSIELVKLRRFAVLKGEHTPIGKKENNAWDQVPRRGAGDPPLLPPTPSGNLPG